MPRLPLCKIRIVLMGSPVLLLLLLIGCKAPSNRPTENGNPAQKVTPMSTRLPNTPMVSGPITYLALGDSTGSGVGAIEGGYVARLFKRIATRRPGSRLTNLCFSGATTSDVLRDQLESGVRTNPQLVTLGIGINDIGHYVSLEEFSQNYQEILSRLNNNTRATIVITNIPDISSAPQIPVAMRSEYHQRIIEFNGRLAEIAATHGAIVFDIYTVTHQELPAHPEYFSDDGFHPSDKGYELWAERMWPTIARTIGVDVETTSISR